MNREDAWVKVSLDVWFAIGAISPIFCGYLAAHCVEGTSERDTGFGTVALLWGIAWMAYWVMT